MDFERILSKRSVDVVSNTWTHVGTYVDFVFSGALHTTLPRSSRRSQRAQGPDFGSPHLGMRPINPFAGCAKRMPKVFARLVMPSHNNSQKVARGRRIWSRHTNKLEGTSTLAVFFNPFNFDIIFISHMMECDMNYWNIEGPKESSKQINSMPRCFLSEGCTD